MADNRPLTRVRPIQVWLNAEEFAQLQRLRTKTSKTEPASMSSIVRHALKQYAAVEGV
jgi:hypothetical protein